MQLNATLTHLAAQRGALVAAAASPQFTALVDQLQVPAVLPVYTHRRKAERATPARAPPSLQPVRCVESDSQFANPLASNWLQTSWMRESNIQFANALNLSSGCTPRSTLRRWGTASQRWCAAWGSPALRSPRARPTAVRSPLSGIQVQWSCNRSPCRSCTPACRHQVFEMASPLPAAAKLEEMQAGLDEVVGKIHGLEQRKAALLQELEALDRQLFKVRTQLDLVLFSVYIT